MKAKTKFKIFRAAHLAERTIAGRSASRHCRRTDVLRSSRSGLSLVSAVAAVLAFALFSSVASAEYADGSTDAAQQTTNSGQEKGFSVSAGSTGGSGTGSSSKQAKKAQNIQYATGTVSMGVGGYLIKAGMAANAATPGSGTLMIVMGTMTTAQGVASIATAAGSKDSGDKSSVNIPSFSFNPPPGSDTPSDDNACPGCPQIPTIPPLPGGDNNDQPNNNYVPNSTHLMEDADQKLKQAMQALKEQGYALDLKNKTLKTPSGKTVPLSTMGSAEGMKAAGFSESAIRSAMAKSKAVAEKEMEKYKGLLDGAGGVAGFAGGGGGGSGSHRSGGRNDSPQNIARFNPYAPKEKKNPVIGLSKKLGDDNIGVASDNIFEMISRRYQARRAASAFITEP